MYIHVHRIIYLLYYFSLGFFAAAVCPPLPAVTNAHETIYDPAENATITIWCLDGFWFGSGIYSVESVCLSNDTWSFIPAACVGMKVYLCNSISKNRSVPPICATKLSDSCLHKIQCLHSPSKRVKQIQPLSKVYIKLCVLRPFPKYYFKL